MNKQIVLQQLQAAYDSMLTAIRGLPDEAMLRIGAVGIWSVKDILAHVTAWKSELVTALSRLGQQAPNIVLIEDIDEWNLEQYRVNAPRDLDIVLEDYHGVHRHLVKTIESMDDKTLTNVRRFTWMEGEPLTYLVAENGFWHEVEHVQQIVEWRAREGL
jgi:hypothetical protein